MPPRKLSISRIRADSRVRSDDPDLNRTSRRSSGSGSSRPSQRYRSVTAFSTSASSREAKTSTKDNARRGKRPSQPKTSARILHILDDDIEETRVQNLFAPDARAQQQNVSYRTLSLTQQARRDGSEFRLPSLAGMCCSTIASCFDALLPSRDQFEAAATSTAASASRTIQNSRTLKNTSNKRKRSGGRALGADPESDEDQQDYVPSDDDAQASKSSTRSIRSRRDASNAQSLASAAAQSTGQLLAGWTPSELHYLTRKTSEQLKLLSPAASFLLFRTLVEQAPQYLTKTVVSDFFLPPISSTASSSSVRNAANTAARTHVWLPASIPLLSHDKSGASFLVNHLSTALTSALEPKTSVLSQVAAEDMPLSALPSRFIHTQPASFALRSLQLHGLTRLQDGTIARFFETAIPSRISSSRIAQRESILRLDMISLRGCIAVSDRTVTAICRSTGSTLQYLNLDFTDVTAESVSMLMMFAPNLQTLKLGYNDNVSDKTLSAALQAPYTGSLPFSKLINLRLRKCTLVGDIGVASFLKYTHRTLQVLDISGTSVGGANPHSPDFYILLMSFFPSGLPAPIQGKDSLKSFRSSETLPLRKLNLLDTNLDYESLEKMVDRAPHLDTLLLRQMPSRSTHDGMITLLEKMVSTTIHDWKRLHLRILDVGDEFAYLFPFLLSGFRVSTCLTFILVLDTNTDFIVCF
ncbi:uncharacterized protein MEPE_05868 [Melanopsichium pennsylvanicum]|uniref:Uncharacterized protein n=2 Tax=Melanopsichium pennsylvanicum TaxID=63383 RepID=A0AAJ4XTU4_9BASI|nr:putative protein [Melanopsichium pennsylvanicum 4]SNX87158.1 uncharacterized protein MEPE_05868 [Melanopsichium pennsylvanicum]